jgi:ribosome-binding factor A
MPLRKPSRKRLRSLCAEVHPDDGSDPHVFFRKDGSRGKPRHKARQLCRQVAEILDSLLAGDSADALLNDLAVVSVEPAPDSATLLVTVAARPSAEPVHPAATLGRLDRASGWIRTEVAAAITRKRAPLLVYRVVEVRMTTADHD